MQQFLKQRFHAVKICYKFLWLATNDFDGNSFYAMTHDDIDPLKHVFQYENSKEMFDKAKEATKIK